MRKLKKEVYALLCREDAEGAMDEILKLQASKVANTLFTFIQDKDDGVKKRAVKAMGVVVSKMADADMDSARIIMRRLMWSLNDESGGIGWGAPEAMGEIMAVNETLAKEYHRILISYVDSEGNYLEYDPLRMGAVQGIKRLVRARPLLMKEYTDALGL